MTIHATPHVVRENDEPIRHRRLQTLLNRRDRLAAAAAIFEAHRLGDPDEIRDVQYNVEAQIQTEYPDTYDRLLPAWVERDAALVHDGIAPFADCDVCRGKRPLRTAAGARPEAA